MSKLLSKSQSLYKDWQSLSKACASGAPLLCKRRHEVDRFGLFRHQPLFHYCFHPPSRPGHDAADVSSEVSLGLPLGQQCASTGGMEQRSTLANPSGLSLLLHDADHNFSWSGSGPFL